MATAVDEKRSLLERVRPALAGRGLDALVASSPENVLYTAGTSFLTQRMIPDRLALVALTPDREPVFVYCTIEEGSARAESWLSEHRGYREHAERPVEVLAEVLREAGLARGRIGFEGRHLVQRDYRHLAAALPEAELVEADDLFDRLRALKSRSEIDVLGAAALATDAAIRAAFESARPGTTERQVAERLVAEARARGGEKLLHLVVASGANNRKTHADPSETPLEPGGVLRTDFGMTWGRYNSDIARTAFVAPLSPRQAEAYRQLEESQQVTIASMRAGVPASEVFRVCADYYARVGLDFWVPHVGHSVGVGLHERPMLEPFDHTPLEPGMVFMVEPAFTTEDGLLHTEDLVEITERGPRVLSRSADWGQPLVVGS